MRSDWSVNILNKYENMEIIGLEDITDIYDSIGLALMELEDEKDYIVVYGKRDLICELFEMMITDGYSFRYADCDFMDEMLKDTVYMMFVRQDCGVSIEPAYGKKGVPIIHDAKTAFIFMDDCKQDVIDYCVKSDKNVVLFDYEDDCDCDERQCTCTDKDTDDSESTHISRDKHGNPLGFSKTWSTVRDGVHCYSSYSHYSSDVDMRRSIASDFGVRL